MGRTSVSTSNVEFNCSWVYPEVRGILGGVSGIWGVGGYRCQFLEGRTGTPLNGMLRRPCENDRTPRVRNMKQPVIDHRNPTIFEPDTPGTIRDPQALSTPRPIIALLQKEVSSKFIIHTNYKIPTPSPTLSHLHRSRLPQNPSSLRKRTPHVT
jgi:hypothetical protein